MSNKKELEMNDHLRLDKKVSIGIVMALVIQMVYFTSFLTKLDSRVGVIESDHVKIDKVLGEMNEIRVHQAYIIRDIEALSLLLKDSVAEKR